VRLTVAACHSAEVSSRLLAASSVNWSEIHAVRLLGVVGGGLILLWAIKSMFGRGGR
jgi:hypothetical protein